jgi:hypothetical protein
MAIPGTIDDVLESLEAMVDEAIRGGSTIGYFAGLYERVTRAIGRAIVAKSFDDNVRMDLLDRTFAARFLDAWRLHAQGERPTKSWKLAFDALADTRTLVVQHLLLAINAHINLDLGVAAATVAPGASIDSLKGDFDAINAILARLVGAVQLALDEVSPRLKAVSAVQAVENRIFDFALDVARDGAWDFAKKLAGLPADQWTGVIAARDEDVVLVGRAILDHGPIVGPIVRWVRAAEANDVALNIQIVTG